MVIGPQFVRSPAVKNGGKPLVTISGAFDLAAFPQQDLVVAGNSIVGSQYNLNTGLSNNNAPSPYMKSLQISCPFLAGNNDANALLYDSSLYVYVNGVGQLVTISPLLLTPFLNTAAPVGFTTTCIVSAIVPLIVPPNATITFSRGTNAEGVITSGLINYTLFSKAILPYNVTGFAN